ncbi:hypothetical protein ACYOEI_01295 [Singulisphaera rosea]
MLFLQAAGSDFGASHELVEAVSEVIRASDDEPTSGTVPPLNHHNASVHAGFAPRRPKPHPERIVERLERAGFRGTEGLLVALAVHLTLASRPGEADADWIASVAARVGDEDLLLETAGVIFAFNTINRIADARRVRLEYSFLREFKPIRGWVERRLASVTRLAYDLSFKHDARRSSAEMLDRLGMLFERLGASGVPEVFHWLAQSPVVLEGVLEMLESSLTGYGVHIDLMKEAAGITVASRAMPGSGLSVAIEQWLSHGSLPDSTSLRAWAAPSGGRGYDSGLVSACRRYAWQVANTAYTITDEQIHKLSELGLSDAERLDLALISAIFSALSSIEPMSGTAAPASVTDLPLLEGTHDSGLPSMAHTSETTLT